MPRRSRKNPTRARELWWHEGVPPGREFVHPPRRGDVPRLGAVVRPSSLRNVVFILEDTDGFIVDFIHNMTLDEAEAEAEQRREGRGKVVIVDAHHPDLHEYLTRTIKKGPLQLRPDSILGQPEVSIFFEFLNDLQPYQ
jgi:hypothetical protein